ncbi:dienelactone hydrolase family protein [Anaeromyxobacter terrae]|uniref:dienelactone hydrolase family protein n=1 Tax=Anaeromyxobacter terrae TaxID=2925406 RepID=UPI001F578291|nr:dienelactone hydrolase family protein [Anaeromyxobacter sp. SG22]
MTRTTVMIAAAALTMAGAARAEVKTQEVEYKQGDTVLKGFLAYDDAAKGKRPGILVVHEWWGQNQHARNAATKLAKAGYVGFALDMFGEGKSTTHPEDAKAFVAEATKDPAVKKARFDAALAELKAQPQVDPERIGVIGYCFGGGVALDMARAGEDLKALATFHGSLARSGEPAKKGTFVPREILVQTGAADPMVPREQVMALEKEMKAAGVKARVITYPGAKHGFTNPDADKAGMPALAYDAKADRKSWDVMLKYMQGVFGK